MQVVQKLYAKLRVCLKNSTLANICKLANKKQIFFFNSALLHKRFMSEVPMLDGQIMGRGWGSH